MEQTVAELIELGGRIFLSSFPDLRPWTTVRFPRRKWAKDNPAAVEYADTTPHPKALADILQCVKDDIASGALV